MPSSSSIRDTDRGFKRILKMLTREARRARVEVGWFADKKHPSGIATAEIAAVQEYGSPELNIPERSVLRRTVDEHRMDYERRHRDVWGRAIDGTEPLERGLLRFGQKIRTDAVETLNEGPHAANAPSTIARKGSSQPLVDRGIMRDQIDVRVGVGS